MKKHLFFLFIPLVMVFTPPGILHAGQVVTEKDYEWARQILSQEKSLAGIQKKYTLAVLYFRNRTQNRNLDPFQKGIAIMLMTDLSKVKNLTLLERTKIQALLDEMNMGSLGLVAKEAIPETGKLLGASRIVSGNFMEGTEGRIDIPSDIFNVAYEKTDKTVSASGMYQELITIEKDLAFQIIEFLNIELSKEEEENIKKPMSENLRALGFYFTGIDLSDQGKYQTAKRYFEKAVTLDPGLTAASQAISELIELDLAPETPETEKVLNTIRKRTSTIGTLGFDNRINRASGSNTAGEPDTNEPGATDITVRW